MPITSSQTKRKLRAAGRKGRAKQAKMARMRREAQVRRVLAAEQGGLLNVREIADRCGRSSGVVRAALIDLEGVEKVGTQYRFLPTEEGSDGE